MCDLRLLFLRILTRRSPCITFASSPDVRTPIFDILFPLFPSEFLCSRSIRRILPSFSQLFFLRVDTKRTYSLLLLLLLIFFSLSLSSSLSLFSVHLGRALNRIKDKASAVATTRHDNGEQWDGIWSVSYSNLFATKGHSLRWRSRTGRKHFDRSL